VYQLPCCPVPADEKHLCRTILPPPYFTVGVVWLEAWEVLGLHHTSCFEFWPKRFKVSWSHVNTKPFPTCFLANWRFQAFTHWVAASFQPRFHTDQCYTVLLVWLTDAPLHMIHSLTNDPSTMGFLSRKCDCNFNDSQVDHANGKEIVSLLGQFFSPV